MDPILLHLRINHAPIMFGVVGALFFLVGFLMKRVTLMRYGQISLLIAGVSAPAAFFSGREAEEHTEHTWYIERKVVHEHEESGEAAAIVMSITGLLALASLVASARNRPARELRIINGFLLIASLAAAGAMVKTGYEGGKIVHSNEKLTTQPSALPQSAQ